MNTAVYRTFSFSKKPGEEENIPEIVMTSSSFTRGDYGYTLMDDLRQRLGVINGYDKPIDFIISTIMNPWLSNTIKGSFIPNLIEIITTNLIKIVSQVKTGTNS